MAQAVVIARSDRGLSELKIHGVPGQTDRRHLKLKKYGRVIRLHREQLIMRLLFLGDAA
jgi:hypothetical protein